MKEALLNHPIIGFKRRHKRFLSLSFPVFQSIFRIGELYLFHHNDPRCPAKGSLWGIFDRRELGCLYLESSSLDLQTFYPYHILPVGYRYCRLASRGELRDYLSGLIYSECHRGLADVSAFNKKHLHFDYEESFFQRKQ